MRKGFLLKQVLLASVFFLSACNLEGLIPSTKDSDLSLDEKVVLGLRKALEVGIDSSSISASKVNGYLSHKVIKILLPTEAEQALTKAEEIASYVKPFSSQLNAMETLVSLTPGADKSAYNSNSSRSKTILSQIASLETVRDSLVKYMNRAAEYAAPRSVPIFKGAIKSMTLTDGLSLLNSADSTAATSYLNGKTFNPLLTSYTPIVDSTLALVPLTKYWGDFRSAYNTLLTDYKSLVAFQESWNGNTVVSQVSALQVNKLKKTDAKPIETESLGAWTTDRALTGLFYLVGEEEKHIRRDPLGYVKSLVKDAADLLREVFGEIMKMEK